MNGTGLVLKVSWKILSDYTDTTCKLAFCVQILTDTEHFLEMHRRVCMVLHRWFSRPLNDNAMVFPVLDSLLVFGSVFAVFVLVCYL